MPMYVTSSSAVAGTDREAHGEGWHSRRLVLARDGRPVSVHETRVRSGTVLDLCYSHHTETVYCVSGRARLTDHSDGRSHDIVAGCLYCARVGDDHRLEIIEDCTFVCVFDPPLVGQEEAD
jgi:L-ectoine synthase